MCRTLGTTVNGKKKISPFGLFLWASRDHVSSDEQDYCRHLYNIHCYNKSIWLVTVKETKKKLSPCKLSGDLEIQSNGGSKQGYYSKYQKILSAPAMLNKLKINLWKRPIEKYTKATLLRPVTANLSIDLFLEVYIQKTDSLTIRNTTVETFSEHYNDYNDFTPFYSDCNMPELTDTLRTSLEPSPTNGSPTIIPIDPQILNTHAGTCLNIVRSPVYNHYPPHPGHPLHSRPWL